MSENPDNDTAASSDVESDAGLPQGAKLTDDDLNNVWVGILPSPLSVLFRKMMCGHETHQETDPRCMSASPIALLHLPQCALAPHQTICHVPIPPVTDTLWSQTCEECWTGLLQTPHNLLRTPWPSDSLCRLVDELP